MKNVSTKKGQRRQGDIYFLPVRQCPVALIEPEPDGVPVNAKEKGDGVVAKGEATGHHHRLSSASKAALMVAAGLVYVRSMGDKSTVEHEEHGDVKLLDTDYRAIRQREYEPGGWRRVVD